MMGLRHAFRGSRANRDRRDQVFARTMIGLAEQRRREEEQVAREALPEVEHCARCGDPLPLDAPNHPYCSLRCGVEASLEGED